MREYVLDYGYSLSNFGIQSIAEKDKVKKPTQMLALTNYFKSTSPKKAETEKQ